MNNEPPAHTVIGNFSNLKHKINNKWPMNGKLQQKIIADTLIIMFLYNYHFLIIYSIRANLVQNEAQVFS